MAKRSFKCFVEKEIGKFPFFVIYALLEWTLIIVLFIDVFLAFFANEFAKFFELKIPCLLCTRINHTLVHRDTHVYYNHSICESHKKDISSLAYCHVHKKLSNMRKMCDDCLLSFATGKDFDCDAYNSLVGILHKDFASVMDNDREIHLTLPASGRRSDSMTGEKNNVQRCSCCGGELKVKSSTRWNGLGLRVSEAPAPSPREPFVALGNEENCSTELPHIRYTELKFSSDNESEIQDEDDGLKTLQLVKPFREGVKAVTVPLLEPEDINEDRTPNLARGNRFFGISLSDSANNSPRWANRILRKSLLEKTEFASESAEGNTPNEVDNDSILHHLKRQVLQDRKSLMALKKELDEERSASAVAANNAMAMIMRLQGEKAAVQMEALQYQRMMEEQAEYDQEALQAMNDIFAKREEDIQLLEASLEAYKSKHGELDEATFCNYVALQGEAEEFHESKAQSQASYLGKWECGNEEETSSLQDRSEREEEEKPKEVLSGRTCGFAGGCLEKLEKLQLSMDDASTSMQPSTRPFYPIKEEIEEQDSNDSVIKQLSHLNEVIKSLREDGEFLKQDSGAHENGSQKRKVLTHISEGLQMLHNLVKIPFGDDYDE